LKEVALYPDSFYGIVRDLTVYGIKRGTPDSFYGIVRDLTVYGIKRGTPDSFYGI
jgi:hypothetical protein